MIFFRRSATTSYNLRRFCACDEFSMFLNQTFRVGGQTLVYFPCLLKESVLTGLSKTQTMMISVARSVWLKIDNGILPTNQER